MLTKQFIQDYFHADFKSADSLLNEILIPIFGDYEKGYTEITLDTPKAQEMARAAHILTIKHIATLQALAFDIKVFDVTLDEHCHIHQARKGIQALVRQFVDRFEGAFIIFHYANPVNRSWRLSYLEKRSTNAASTNAKRYTYLCGQQYPCRTIAERFDVLQKEEKTAVNLEKAFSVETLSDEFFNEYRYFYDDFVNFVTNEDNLIDQFKSLAENNQEKASKMVRDYIKKLMGRLVFIQFLQNKGWLNNDIHYTHTLFDTCTDSQKDNFLDNVLEPLFFGVFNTPKAERETIFRQEGWDIDLYSRWKDFPYLNGGLFERDELDRLKLPIPSYFFSNPEHKDIIRKPTDKYYDDSCGIFDFFDRYNFTIDESDPLDNEVGVDPEMLGKIFENLLEDNKDKGAFYTPKEIVQYMCKEALIAYLIDEARRKSEVNKQRQSNFEDAIRAFVNDPEMTVIRMQKYGNQQLKDLNESLCEVKICDPAIGSGAFPMGLLNLLMNCRVALNNALGIGQPRYWMKKDIIQNNIYGVDIEKGAIDIARLRFWLSIVVDLEEPEALPNFDYKFMQGNSLLEQFEGKDLSNMFETSIDTGKKGGKDTPLIIFDEESTRRVILNEKLKKYFTSSAGVDKHQLRNDVNKAVRDLIAEKVSGNQEFISKLDAIDISANDKFFLWHTWFADVFNRPSKQGFDIVIGNPPYIDSETMTNVMPYMRGLYAKEFTCAKGNWDMFVLFIELGMKLLASSGVYSFIIPNKLIAAKYAETLREFISTNTIFEIRDYGNVPVFTNAAVYPATIVGGIGESREYNIHFAVMENVADKSIDNSISTDEFANIEFWDLCFQPSEYYSLFSKINRHPLLKNDNAYTFIGAATVSEAYLIKEVLHNREESCDGLRMVNTGTIDKYTNLWGVFPMQYIKGRYQYPIIKEIDLAQISQKRLEQAKSCKIIVAGMSKYIEAIYDDGHTLAGKSTTIILGDSDKLKFLLAILNSTLASFFTRIAYNSLKMAGGFINVGSRELENLYLFLLSLLLSNNRSLIW